MHIFKDSLAKGSAGEALFHQNMPHLKRLDGRKSDFIDEATGETYELKTDSYDMDATPNFFIEVYSDLRRKKVGGPAQALDNGTTYWVYMFRKNRTMFIFKTVELVEALKDIKLPIVRIQNMSWVTTGMKVERNLLSNIYKEVRLEK